MKYCFTSSTQHIIKALPLIDFHVVLDGIDQVAFEHFASYHLIDHPLYLAHVLVTAFQDSTLQRMLVDVQQEFADMDDVNDELASAFERLRDEMPALEVPHIYAQIGSFDQSVIVADGSLGISLDKYLGSDYSFYKQNYSSEQRRIMNRSMIVPDCLSFYLLSLYPMPRDLVGTQKGRDQHMSKIQWVVNEVIGREVFQSDLINSVEHYMKINKGQSFDDMLRAACKTVFQ